MTPAAGTDTLDSLRRHVPAILRVFAEQEFTRLNKLADMTERARSEKEIHAILGTAARGAQTIAPRRRDWREHALFLLGELEGAAEPETGGCCVAVEPCPFHAQHFDAADFAVALGRAVKDAADLDDLGMRIAEIIAGGGGR